MPGKDLQLTMDTETQLRITWLTQHLPNAPRTMSKTIRIALHLLEAMMQAHERGATVWMRESDGTERKMVIE